MATALVLAAAALVNAVLLPTPSRGAGHAVGGPIVADAPAVLNGG
ncbi:MAG: hypothetical protein AAFX81_14610 [Pseudomonadota bacterium]